MGHHAVRGFVIGEGEDGITRASRLESAHFLEIFALEKDLAARHLIDRLTGEDGRPMDVRLDPPGGGSDVIKAWAF